MKKITFYVSVVLGSILLLFSNSHAAEAEWEISIVDSAIVSWMYTSLALDSNNNPHISYIGPGIKYAYWDGNWHTERVDGGEGCASIALDSNDNPHISYYDNRGYLKYAHWDGTWHTKTVDNSLDEGYR